MLTHTMKPNGCQVLIVGVGITGLTVARELVNRRAGDILILEKEPALSYHASGRNSGVLHTGIYYTPIPSGQSSAWRGTA